MHRCGLHTRKSRVRSDGGRAGGIAWIHPAIVGNQIGSPVLVLSISLVWFGAVKLNMFWIVPGPNVWNVTWASAISAYLITSHD